MRAVLLIGTDPRNRPQQELPESICVAEYAPYSALFPRAALVVHQGGVGTTAQCLRAGRPMLIMPYSHDQPDNARRMRRMGVARVIQRASYKPWRVARRVRAMLAEPEYDERARSAAEEVAREDGVKTACDALEKLGRQGSGVRGSEDMLPETTRIRGKAQSEKAAGPSTPIVANSATNSLRMTTSFSRELTRPLATAERGGCRRLPAAERRQEFRSPRAAARGAGARERGRELRPWCRRSGASWRS